MGHLVHLQCIPSSPTEGILQRWGRPFRATTTLPKVSPLPVAGGPEAGATLQGQLSGGDDSCEKGKIRLQRYPCCNKIEGVVG